MRAPLALTAAALALAIPATASAHSATVACDPQSPNGYRVDADWRWLDPVPTFSDSTVTVVWSDRYRVVLPLPAGCVPPVVPAPVPEPTAPGTDVVPPANPAWPPAPDAKQEAPVLGSAAPPVVTPGKPEPMPRKRVTPRKKPTCRYLLAHRAGKWSYVKLGYYPRCRAPKPPRKYLARVPVAG